MKRLLELWRRRKIQAGTISTGELSSLIDGDPWMTDAERRYHGSDQFGR